MRIIVDRVSDDKLSMQTWVFTCLDIRELEIILDEFYDQKRETTRHKFRNVKCWQRLSERNSNMKVSEVSFPDDVAAEAKKQFIDQITIVKERSR